jgi:K+-transporting ATPase ATPase C chain
MRSIHDREEQQAAIHGRTFKKSGDHPMSKLLRQSFVLLLLMTVITGVLYPLAATGLAQLIFPQQANGSLIVKDGKPVGSVLIGQSFTDPKYFWGRPSATSPNAYNASASSGSNLGPTNPALTDAVKQRIAALRAADPGNTAPVPVDLVTASGSGLDPEISPAAAQYQLERVAKARGLSTAQVQALVNEYTSGRQLGVLGEPRVNVLQLNLALDAPRLVSSPRRGED